MRYFEPCVFYIILVKEKEIEQAVENECEKFDLLAAQIKYKSLKQLIFMRYFRGRVFYIILVKEKESLDVTN